METRLEPNKTLSKTVISVHLRFGSFISVHLKFRSSGLQQGVPRTMKMFWAPPVWWWSQLPVVEGFEQLYLVVVPDLGHFGRFIQTP